MFPKLLVSVRDSEEALAALDGGADVIDVKEPLNGPLGAGTSEQLDGVRAATAGRVPLSAALGELVDGPTADRLDALGGYSYAKVGLSRCGEMDGWQDQWFALTSNLPKGVLLVAVVYADYGLARAPRPEQIIRIARSVGIPFLLIDTFEKRAGSVFQHLSDRELSNIVAAARQCQMSVAIAGSLTLELLPAAMALGPDVIAVRGAVCKRGRGGDVDASLVRQLAERLSTPCP